MKNTYTPFPPGTVRGPYYSHPAGYPRQVQFLVRGVDGWVPFSGPALREKEIETSAKEYAQKVKNAQ